MRGQPGIIHDRTPIGNQVSWAWMRPQVLDLTTDRSFDSQANLVTSAFGFFLDVIDGYLYTQALPAVQSPSGGIRCLYCIHQ